ncbi:MAG: hypothetical protein Q9195_007080 [Heterodermia aff. obscurata]
MEKLSASDITRGLQDCADLPAERCRHISSLGSTDIEDLSGLQNVSVNFQGSGCPGCVRKISRALESIPFLHNLRLSTIPLQATFDVEITKISVRGIMQAVRTKTGRQCERVGEGWQKLVVLSNSTASLVHTIPPEGVMDIETLRKDTFCIRYDAEKIGARELLKALQAETGFPIDLAPAEAYDDLPVDVRRTGCLTCVSSVLTLPILILAWAPFPKHVFRYDVTSLVLATLIQVVVAGPFYPKALRSLLVDKTIDMDLLVVLSTSITYLLSVASFVCEAVGSQLTSGMYFETSALLISLILLGRFMADFACHRVIRSKSVRSIQPRSAFLVDMSAANGNTSREIDVRLLQLDDTIEIKPGHAAPTDGVLLFGESKFDESILTGEDGLILKSEGCAVIAGSTNKSAAVAVRVSRLPGRNSISDIADVVEEVSRSKPRSQLIADEIACWVVPAIGILAVSTLLVWFLIGKLVRNQPAGSAILHAVPYAVSVLVVSCPCAIGLAVPIVQVVASNIAANHGLILKSSEVMTMARKVNHVVFDKTGTLTNKEMSVLDEHYCSKSKIFVAALTLALTSSSEHPVSSAVAKHLKCSSLQAVHVTNLATIAGKGIKGMLNGQSVRVGNPRWLGVEHFPLVQSVLYKNLTTMCVVQGDELVAVFGLHSAIRSDAAELIVKLKQRGIRVSIMSGDESGAVHRVATALQIPLRDTWSRCTPLEKQQHVKEFMQSQANTVLFCGDGANDAAALTQASVGLHVTNGVGFVDSTADAVITSSSLKSILLLLDLSWDCYFQILFGFSWSAFYNLFAIMLAAGLLIKIRLPPEYAGLGEMISVLPVVIVPLRLRWKKYLKS